MEYLKNVFFFFFAPSPRLNQMANENTTRYNYIIITPDRYINAVTAERCLKR